MFIFWPVENCTTWNLWYLMLRDAGWALRHWRSCLYILSISFAGFRFCCISHCTWWYILFVKNSFISVLLRAKRLLLLQYWEWKGYYCYVIENEKGIIAVAKKKKGIIVVWLRAKRVLLLCHWEWERHYCCC